MDLVVRRFQQNIINFINQTDLPIEIKRLCLGEIYRQLEETSNQEINRQLQEEQKESEQKEGEVNAKGV